LRNLANFIFGPGSRLWKPGESAFASRSPLEVVSLRSFKLDLIHARGIPLGRSPGEHTKRSTPDQSPLFPLIRLKIPLYDAPALLDKQGECRQSTLDCPVRKRRKSDLRQQSDPRSGGIRSERIVALRFQSTQSIFRLHSPNESSRVRSRVISSD
jgi:hypothetical protein